MFGGLEVKGKSGVNDAEEAPAPAPSASASAFGFLNAASAAAPADAPAAAAPSSFSFLYAAPEPAAPPPPAIAASGFSFLSHDAAAPAPAPASEPAAGGSMSGFSFLIPSPSSDSADGSGGMAAGGGGAAHLPPVEETGSASAEEVAAPPPFSGFSFLSSGIPEPDLPSAAAETQDLSLPSMVLRSVSSSSVSSGVGPSLSTSAADATTHPPSAASSGFPAGAGITFGTSSKRNVVKKKNYRAHRVGSAANSGAAAPGGSAAAPVPAPQPTLAQAEAKSAREAAAEAAHRAEAFMRAKAVEEANTVAAPPAPSSPRLTGKEAPLSPPAIQPSASTDEVVAAAQAAAKEAQILQQQQQHQKGGGFMGTFFKGFRASPTPTITGSTGSSHGGTAERQINLQQQQQQQQQQQTGAHRGDDDDDDDNVVVSTSVGGYVPEPFAPAPAPVSSFMPVTLPEVTTTATSTSTANSNDITANIATQQLSSAFSSSKQGHDFKIPSSPSPRRMKTPKQMFEEYQALFAQSVHRAMDQVENVRSQQKILLEERFLALAKDRLATHQIAQTESQLLVAVEEEEYELADQLGQVVEGHRREKQEVALMLENITRALAQLNSQKSLVMKSVATCFDNLSVRLEELKEKEAASERKDDEETFKQFSLISKQQSAEHERLQQDLKHLERDEQLVAEERKELEDSIKEQTGEIETQKVEVSTRLDEVQKEIDELRKRLELKQKEAAELRTAVFGFEDSISKVRVKFSRQLTRVDKKERALKESRSEWEIEDATHKRQKEAHELQVQSHSEALLVHDALMTTLESELKLSKEFCEIIPTQLGFGDGDQSEEGESDNGEEGDLAQLQADVVTCEAAVSEAKVILKVAAAALTNLVAERDRLVARIPELEAQKVAAASNRDFKAASKASKEIKDATTRIKECEEVEAEAMSKKQAAEEELARVNAELVNSQELARVKEKIAGQQKMVSLAKQISQLAEKKREICGECTSEENSVRGVGALVLEGQIKALRAEGQDIGSKFGGWTELTRELQIDIPQSSSIDVRPEDASNNESIKGETTTPQEGMPAQVDDGLTSEERIVKVRQLMVQISEAEKALEAAASREDFDEAVRLEEVFQSLQAEVEKMNLTDDEAEFAMEDEATSATRDDSPIPEQVPSATPDDYPIPEHGTSLVEESTLAAEATTPDEYLADEDGASAEEEKKETTDENPVSEGENSAPIDDAQANGDDAEAEAEAFEEGKQEDSTPHDEEVQTGNGDTEIIEEDEFEETLQNGNVGNDKEIEPEEASLNVDCARNGKGSLEEENTKPDSVATSPEESTSV